MTTRAHISQEHLQEAVKLLEGSSEEVSGYILAKGNLRARNGNV